MKKVQIGDCTLYQGDCLEIMPGLGRVDHIISDPPYEKETQDKLRRSKRKDKGPELKGVTFQAIDDIRKSVVECSQDILDGWGVFFCTVDGVNLWKQSIDETSLKFKRACAWVKPDSTPQLNGQCPAQGFECFVTAWGGAGASKWNSGGKRGVYTHCVNGPKRDGRHPTEKPIALMQELLFDFTNEGQTILDPFMGSGTTGVACAKTGRKFIGIELDEKYFDIACERIEKAYQQRDLFVAAPEKLKQESLL